MFAEILNILQKKLYPHKYNLLNFNKGYDVFLNTGQTPTDAYMSFLQLYCTTNGEFCDLKHQEIIKDNPSKKINGTINGVIGNLTEYDLSCVNSELKTDGYTFFEKKLPSDVIERLCDFALKTPTKFAPNYDTITYYKPDQPISEIYRFDLNDLINNIDIQNLIMDPTLINVARNYLGCEPIFDFPAMWWSTSYLKEASAEAAQLYHFDLDRIKWLKVFIYLTDVGQENGPHCYVKGSHIAKKKPMSLLKRGYARIPDNDINQFYKKEDFITITAEAGSIFAGDTKCWHKGKPLKKSHRLVLEFEYTSSLFGANYPKLEIEKASLEFQLFCKENPRYVSNFVFKKL